MITTIILDFSRVLLFPKEKNYKGKLNALHKELLKKSNYDVLEYFELNDELLTYLDKLKGKVDLYVFTTGVIQNSPKIKSRLNKTFRSVFAAEELDLNKKYPDSYLIIAKKLRKKPGEILFVDDAFENVKAAKKAGLTVIHFRTNSRFIAELSKYII